VCQPEQGYTFCIALFRLSCFQAGLIAALTDSSAAAGNHNAEQNYCTGASRGEQTAQPQANGKQKEQQRYDNVKNFGLVSREKGSGGDVIRH
jgi:hypothetical protein